MRKMKFQLKYPDSDGNKGKKKQKISKQSRFRLVINAG